MMSQKFYLPLFSIGVILILVQLLMIGLSLFGVMNYYPILQFIGIGLLTLYAFDQYKYNRSKHVYLVLGIFLIVLGIFLHH